jgi:hypothetical protein
MAKDHPTTESIPANKDYGEPIPWDEGRGRLAEMPSYTLTTLNADGTPHVRPLLAVWLDGAVFFSSKETSRKGRNLARDGRCTLSGWSGEPRPLDIVVEGKASRVTDEAMLRRIAAVYDSKYGWKVEVRNGRFDAEYGAPTAGPPPYSIYELTPALIYGFPGVGGADDTADPLTPTRWRF